MRIAALQMVSTPAIASNLAAAENLIAQASEQGAELVLLPEVFATLEGLSELSQVAELDCGLQQESARPLQDFLSRCAKTYGLVIVGGTIPLVSRPDGTLIDEGRVRASCLVFDAQGSRLARYDKIHLFDVKVNDEQTEYSESRSYEPGETLCCVEAGALRLGLSVCYDLRFPELYTELSRRGANLITVPAAFTAVTGAAHWEPLLRARAIETQCFVLAAGQGGRHSETRETWGHSMIISPWGEVLACIEKGEGIAVADIDLDSLAQLRQAMPIADHRRL